MCWLGAVVAVCGGVCVCLCSCVQYVVDYICYAICMCLHSPFISVTVHVLYWETAIRAINYMC